MKLTYTLTKQQLLDFGVYLAVEAPAAKEQLKKKRWQLSLAALIPAAVALLSFARFFEEGRSAQLLLGMGGTAAIGIVCYMALRLTRIMERRTRRQLEDEFRTRPMPELTLDMGGGALLVEGDGQTAILPLRQYTGCEKWAGCRYLLFGTRGVCIPETVLEPSDWETLMAQLRGRK